MINNKVNDSTSLQIKFDTVNILFSSKYYVLISLLIGILIMVKIIACL